MYFDIKRLILMFLLFRLPISGFGETADVPHNAKTFSEAKKLMKKYTRYIGYRFTADVIMNTGLKAVLPGIVMNVYSFPLSADCSFNSSVFLASFALAAAYWARISPCRALVKIKSIIK